MNENSKADCLWHAAISLNVARLECSIRVYNHKYSITVKIHHDCSIWVYHSYYADKISMWLIPQQFTTIFASLRLDLWGHKIFIFKPGVCLVSWNHFYDFKRLCVCVCVFVCVCVCVCVCECVRIPPEAISN